MSNVKLTRLSLSLSTELHPRQQPGSVCGWIPHHSSPEYPFSQVLISKLKHGANHPAKSNFVSVLIKIVHLTLRLISVAACFFCLFVFLLSAQTKALWSVCVPQREDAHWTGQTHHTKTGDCSPFNFSSLADLFQIQPLMTGPCLRVYLFGRMDVSVCVCLLPCLRVQWCVLALVLLCVCVCVWGGNDTVHSSLLCLSPWEIAGPKVAPAAEQYLFVCAHTVYFFFILCPSDYI